MVLNFRFSTPRSSLSRFKSCASHWSFVSPLRPRINHNHSILAPDHNKTAGKPWSNDPGNDRMISNDIEWYRMISNDIELIHEVSRIIHFSESSIQRLSDYQSIQTDSPSFHWPGWPGWPGANVCGISLRCLDAAIFLEVSWQRKWQANTTVLPQDSK